METTPDPDLEALHAADLEALGAALRRSLPEIPSKYLYDHR